MSSNRVKLTNSFIDQLELIPAIYRDSELIGFAMRVNNSYKTYIVEKKINGKSTRSTLGIHGQLTLAQARILAQETLLEMTKGINPNEKKKISNAEKLSQLSKSQPTLSDAYSIYIAKRILKQRSLKDYTIVIDKYLVDWKDIKLEDITGNMIQDRHKELSDKSKAQANMCMRVFRAIYNFSLEYYLDEDENPILPSLNPITALTTKKSWNKIKRRKTHINEGKLPDWIDAVMNFKDRGQQLETNKDFLLTLILTGFKRDECESLAWSAIDLKNGFITSINSKNGKSHRLPMGEYLWAMMKKRKAVINSDWVFPSAKSMSGHITNISKVRDKINTSCGIQFTFHDLKRTFGSIAESLDSETYTIKNILNHKEVNDQDGTKGYVQIGEKKLRLFMNEIENIVLGKHKNKSDQCAQITN